MYQIVSGRSVVDALGPGDALEGFLDQRAGLGSDLVKVVMQGCVLITAIFALGAVDLERGEVGDELGQVMRAFAVDRRRRPCEACKLSARKASWRHRTREIPV